MLPNKIRIVEVSPRDGFQNEKNLIPLMEKVSFIDRLAQTGLQEIEAGAFVREDRIPQMADSMEVFNLITRKQGVLYSALVPNEYGLDQALEAEADKIAVFTSASETFNRKNINASIDESLERFRPVLLRARQSGLPVRGYISTAFWCPYEGKIDPVQSAEICLRILDLGILEISIGDTIGKAAPDEVRAFLEILLKRVSLECVFMHFHDTYGKALENSLCAWKEFGVTGFDSSAGGLGGCPYAPGSSGNAATEDLLEAFKTAGAAVPAEPADVAKAAAPLSKLLDHPLNSRLSRQHL